MKLKRILKMHKIHIETRADKLFCCSEFCWRVFRTYTWLDVYGFHLPSVLSDLTFHINTFNPGMQCSVYKDVMEDMTNAIREAKCILTCQLSSLSLFWASSKSSKPKKDLQDIFLWHLCVIKLLVFLCCLIRLQSRFFSYLNSMS